MRAGSLGPWEDWRGGLILGQTSDDGLGPRVADIECPDAPHVVDVVEVAEFDQHLLLGLVAAAQNEESAQTVILVAGGDDRIISPKPMSIAECFAQGLRQSEFGGRRDNAHALDLIVLSELVEVDRNPRSVMFRVLAADHVAVAQPLCKSCRLRHDGFLVEGEDC